MIWSWILVWESLFSVTSIWRQSLGSPAAHSFAFSHPLCVVIHALVSTYVTFVAMHAEFVITVQKASTFQIDFGHRTLLRKLNFGHLLPSSLIATSAWWPLPPTYCSHDKTHEASAFGGRRMAWQEHHGRHRNVRSPERRALSMNASRICAARVVISRLLSCHVILLTANALPCEFDVVPRAEIMNMWLILSNTRQASNETRDSHWSPDHTP